MSLIRSMNEFILSYAHIANYPFLNPNTKSCVSVIMTFMRSLRLLVKWLIVLASPNSAKIHPIFHYSLLKPHHGPLPTPQELPAKFSNGKIIVQPHFWLQVGS